jgi:tight adherence protein B
MPTTWCPRPLWTTLWVMSTTAAVLTTAVFGAFVAVCAGALETSWHRKRVARQHIQRHLPPTAPGAAYASLLARARAGGKRRSYAQRAIERFSAALADAGIRADPRQVLGRVAVAAVLTFALVGVLTGVWPLALAAGVCAPVLVCWVALGRRRDGLRKRLVGQVPAAFEAISNAMLAGSTLPHAVAQAAEELPAPIAGLLSAASARYRVGRQLEDVLIELQQQVRLPVMEFAVSSILVNRQSGGNLAELLLDAAELVREDLQLQRELQSATAQSRLSAQIVGLLPVLLFGALAVLNPTSVTPFFESPAGILMLVVAALLDTAGFVLVLRVSRVEF